MIGGERALDVLLRTMDPVLHEEPVAFCAVTTAPADAIATFREAEGLTAIVTKREAGALGLASSYDAAWITLNVHSDLDAVGFLAAISARLATEGISVNVMSALWHDHLFVPWSRRDDAMRVLRAMQRE